MPPLPVPNSTIMHPPSISCPIRPRLLTEPMLLSILPYHRQRLHTHMENNRVAQARHQSYMLVEIQVPRYDKQAIAITGIKVGAGVKVGIGCDRLHRTYCGVIGQLATVEWGAMLIVGLHVDIFRA